MDISLTVSDEFEDRELPSFMAYGSSKLESGAFTVQWWTGRTAEVAVMGGGRLLVALVALR